MSSTDRGLGGLLASDSKARLSLPPHQPASGAGPPASGGPRQAVGVHLPQTWPSGSLAVLGGSVKRVIFLETQESASFENS